MIHPGTELASLSEIERRATACGLGADPRRAARLLSAAEWLAGLAGASGISGYDSAAEALRRGLMPALGYFAFAEAPKSGRVADLGAGAGALGTGIAILAESLEVSLVDRSKRALTACELMAARLKLANLLVVEMNLGLDAEVEPMYDGVVFRALAPGGDALALARGVVRVGGFIAAYHREGDPAFSGVSEVVAASSLKALRVVPSGVPGLAVTGFEVLATDSHI